MSSKKIMEFYNGRYFEIPKYQRGYAWEKRNIRELFDDIVESIESKSSHYIGTIVLSKHEDVDHYYLVDGQQRVTTITLIINELLRHLRKSDADYYRKFYIKDGSYRLKPLGKDTSYLLDIMNNRIKEPKSKSQRYLYEAFEEVRTFISGHSDKLQLLKAVEKLEVMEFVEASEGDAIRIFQTVNDRGKVLTNMEKAKSLLIYFSNRYLGKSLDGKINDTFGDIFELYEDIKQIGEASGINLIRNVNFDEDNIMRYHFIAYSDENFDATGSYVLAHLKTKLTSLRNDKKWKAMSKFITNYITSIHSFFSHMKDVLKRTQTDQKYFKLFSILGMSATLYPIVIKLDMLGKLESPLGKPKYKMVDLIEIIDVRIYKTRGTDPRAEISRFACEVNDSWTEKEIEDWLRSYNNRWMTREEFVSNLNSNIYGNRALPHIFITYCEGLQKRKFSLKELIALNAKTPTIEHILAQEPVYSYSSIGFSSKEEFIEHADRLGNLTILEKSLNSAVSSKIPLDKVSYYDRSKFIMTKELCSSIVADGGFKRTHIEQRTDELLKFCKTRWWC